MQAEVAFPQKSTSCAYAVLAAVSNCYPTHKGRLSTRYSPVRHSTQSRSPFLVRLACVKHAASVQSEPESNSPVQICTSILAFAKIGISKSFFPLAIHLSMNHPGHFRPARMMLMHPSARPVNYFFCFPVFFLAKTSSTRHELPFCITSPPLSSLFFCRNRLLLYHQF